MTSPLLLWAILLAAAQGPQGPAPEDPHFARGIEYQKAGRLDEAIAEYELSLKLRPRFPVLANLGSVYARLGRYEEAIARYEQALKLAPGQAAVTLNLGLAYYKTGDFQKSAGLFEQVLKSEPENLQARTLLADCHFQLEDFKKVIEQLEGLAEKRPAGLGIARLLGAAYLPDKQTEKGQRLVDRILSKGDSAEAHLMLGVAFAEAREFKPAIAEFEKAIQLNPNLPQVHASLGRILLQSCDRDRALPEFEAELKIGPKPENFTAHYALGRIYLETNFIPRAVTELEKSARLAPDAASVQFVLAKAYTRANRPAAAARARAEFKRLDAIDKKRRGEATGEESASGRPVP